MATIINTIRWASNSAELAQNLRQGMDVIDSTRAAADKMVQTLSGDRLIAAANKYTAAVIQMGGAAGVMAGAEKLSAGEKERINTLLDKAIEKYTLLGRTAPQAMLDLQAATKSAADATQNAKDAIDHTSGSLDKWVTSLTTAGTALKTTGTLLSTTITAPLVGAALAGEHFAAEFQTLMTRVQTLAGASTAEVAKMGQEVLDLAPKVGVGPAELAKGLFVLESAGFHGAQAMDLLTTAAKMSALGMGETDAVARSLVGVMLTYTKENLSAAEAGDLLVKTVQLGNMKIDELVPALARVNPIAAALGVKFADVAAAIATFTHMGASSEIAATGLRAVLSNILNDSAKTERGFVALQKVVGDTSITMADFRSRMNDEGLGAALLHLMEQAQSAGEKGLDALNKVFPNIKALTEVLAIAGSQAENYKRITTEMHNAAGVLESGFEATQQTFNQKWKELTAQVDVLFIKLGNDLLPTFTKVVELLRDDALPTLEKAVELFSSLPEGVKTAAIAVGALAAALGPTVFVMGSFVGAAGQMVKLFSLLAGAEAVGGATTAITAFGSSVVGVGLGVTGLIVAVGALSYGLTRLADVASGGVLTNWISATERAAASAQAVAAGQDAIALAYARGADHITNATEALKFNTEWLAKRTAALKDAADREAAFKGTFVDSATGYQTIAEKVKALTAAERAEIDQAMLGKESIKEIAEETGIAADVIALYERQTKAATAAQKNFTAAWTNLNTLGQTTEETLSGINPKLLEQASYYASIGATVKDLEGAFPKLSQAQATVIEAASKQLKIYAAAWSDLNSIGTDYQDTVDKIDGKLVGEIQYWIEAGAKVGDLAKAYKDQLTPAQLDAIDKMVKGNERYAQSWQKTEDEITRIWDEAFAFQDRDGARGLALQQANLNRREQKEKDAAEIRIKDEDQLQAVLTAIEAKYDAERANNATTWARKSKEEIAALELQDQHVRLAMYGTALDAQIAANRAELAAHKAKLIEEGKDDADHLAALEQLYKDKAQAIINSYDPLFKAWQSMNVDMRNTWAGTWDQALNGTIGFGTAFTTTLQQAIEDPFKKMLAGLLADWEQQLLGPMIAETHDMISGLFGMPTSTGGGIPGGFGGGIGGWSGGGQSVISSGMRGLFGGSTGTGIPGGSAMSAGSAGEFNPAEVYGQGADAAGNALGAAGGVSAGSVLGGGMMALGGVVGLVKAQTMGQSLIAGTEMGAGIGTMIMPGIGTAIGAGVGFLVGALRHVFGDHTVTDIASMAGTEFGTQFSQATSDAIKADKEGGMSEQGAMYNNLAAIIKDLGGITKDNVDLMTGKFHDLFSMLQTGQMTLKQVDAQLDASFPALAKAATDSYGRISDGLKSIIALNDTFDTQNKAIAAWKSGQAANLTTGVSAIVAAEPEAAYGTVGAGVASATAATQKSVIDIPGILKQLQIDNKAGYAAFAKDFSTAAAAGFKGTISDFFQQQATLYSYVPEGDPRLQTAIYGTSLTDFNKQQAAAGGVATTAISQMGGEERGALKDAFVAALGDGFTGSINDFLLQQNQLYQVAQEGDARLKTWLSGTTIATLNADKNVQGYNAAVGAQQQAAAAAQPELQDVGSMVVGSYETNIATGMSKSDALKAESASLTTLEKEYKDLGLTVTDTALKQLMLQNDITKAQPALLAGIDGVSKAMVAQDNLGTETKENFAAQERVGANMYGRLLNAAIDLTGGYDKVTGKIVDFDGASKIALGGMQTYLHDAVTEAEKLGVPIDANTKAMIDQSIKAGIWQDAIKPQPTVLSLLGDLNKTIGDIDRALRGLPPLTHIAVDETTTHYDVYGNPVTPPPSSAPPPPSPEPPPDRTPLTAAKGAIVPEYFDDGGAVTDLFRKTFTKGTDTVPAMLTPGEMVIDKSQQDMIASLIAGGGSGNKVPSGVQSPTDSTIGSGVLGGVSNYFGIPTGTDPSTLTTSPGSIGSSVAAMITALNSGDIAGLGNLSTDMNKFGPGSIIAPFTPDSSWAHPDVWTGLPSDGFGRMGSIGDASQAMPTTPTDSHDTYQIAMNLPNVTNPQEFAAFMKAPGGGADIVIEEIAYNKRSRYTKARAALNMPS